MKTCENCNNENEGKYGSGRFCSTKCARGYSTKAKRTEINKSVKLKLTKHVTIEGLCENCLTKFKYNSFYVNRKYCSLKCSAIKRNLIEGYKDKLSIARVNSIKNGISNGTGVKSIYLFKEIQISCDSNIERACLNYFELMGASSMKRCDRVLTYIHNNIERRFLPDFEIVLNDNVYIVEAKSYLSSETLNNKWKNYNEKSILKRSVLEMYCKNNNFKSLWFTKDLHLSYYRNIKTI